MATDNFMGLGSDPMPETPVITPETPVEVTAEVPPAVTPPTETPAAEPETPTEAPTPVEVIKEVEKIVEKYPEMDEHQKGLFDAIMEGKEDELYTYLAEKNRDYKTMSDYDVIAANFKRANPKWNNERIELEIEAKYGEQLTRIKTDNIDDPDELIAAEAHNKLVEKNERVLKAHAFDARIELEENKRNITLPKIKQAEVLVDDAPSKEAIELANKQWIDNVTTEVPKLSDFTFKVGDKDNGYEDVSYVVTEAEKKEQLEFMKGFNLPNLAKKLGWIDADGKPDILKTAGDVLKLEKITQLMQSSYTQGKTAGTKGTMADIKNIDLSKVSNGAVPVIQGDLNPFSHLNPK